MYVYIIQQQIRNEEKRNLFEKFGVLTRKYRLAVSAEKGSMYLFCFTVTAEITDKKHTKTKNIGTKYWSRRD